MDVFHAWYVLFNCATVINTAVIFFFIVPSLRICHLFVRWVTCTKLCRRSSDTFNIKENIQPPLVCECALFFLFLNKPLRAPISVHDTPGAATASPSRRSAASERTAIHSVLPSLNDLKSMSNWPYRSTYKHLHAAEGSVNSSAFYEGDAALRHRIWFVSLRTLLF